MKGRKEAFPAKGRSWAVLYAIGVGLGLGLILALLYPADLVSFSSSVKIYSDSDAQNPGARRKLERLQAEVRKLQEERFQAQQMVLDLKRQVAVVEKEREVVLEQLNAAVPGGKAGPPGKVKGLRTQPLVEPDESVNPELAKILKEIAVNNELIVGICDSHVKPMVKLWFESLQRVGVTNFLVVALDDAMARFADEHQVPYYRRDAAISGAQQKAGHNHAVSGLKFHLLRDFLVLGYNVFLSDIDIVFLQSPWPYLTRDSDVEGMTDGFDNMTAYGYDDVSDDPDMGWSRYAHTMRIWVFNSGLFYIRATRPSIELLDRVTGRLARENAWDQAVFNEELFFPSHPGYVGLHASTRVLDFWLFLNSKVLFKEFREKPLQYNWRPVSIHVNYHPDKYDRMVAIVERYVNGKVDALNRFPMGSE